LPALCGKKRIVSSKLNEDLNVIERFELKNKPKAIQENVDDVV